MTFSRAPRKTATQRSKQFECILTMAIKASTSISESETDLISVWDWIVLFSSETKFCLPFVEPSLLLSPQNRFNKISKTTALHTQQT